MEMWEGKDGKVGERRMTSRERMTGMMEGKDGNIGEGRIDR